MIHDGRPVTVHVQPGGADTNTVRLAPAPGNIGLLVGEIVAPAHGPPACATKWLAPAMTIDALREMPLLAATEYVNVPLPVLGNGVVIVIHAGRFHAVHEQPGWAVTFTVNVPPAEPKVGLPVGNTVLSG